MQKKCIKSDMVKRKKADYCLDCPLEISACLLPDLSAH